MARHDALVKINPLLLTFDSEPLEIAYQHHHARLLRFFDAWFALIQVVLIVGMHTGKIGPNTAVFRKHGPIWPYFKVIAAGYSLLLVPREKYVDAREYYHFITKVARIGMQVYYMRNPIEPRVDCGFMKMGALDGVTGGLIFPLVEVQLFKHHIWWHAARQLTLLVSILCFDLVCAPLNILEGRDSEDKLECTSQMEYYKEQIAWVDEKLAYLFGIPVANPAVGGVNSCRLVLTSGNVLVGYILPTMVLYALERGSRMAFARSAGVRLQSSYRGFTTQLLPVLLALCQLFPVMYSLLRDLVGRMTD